MTCAEVEILLCDYVDGTLRGPQKIALEQHIATCGVCSELAQDVTGAVGFMDRTAVVEPPPELLTRILHEIPTMRPHWWRRGFLGRLTGGWLEPLLQPRYAMGMAMTLISFSMIAKFAHIDVRQLTPADLNPMTVYMTAEDRVQRSWSRAVKYYDNLKWVLEVQSRVHELAQQDQEYQQSETDNKSVMPESGAKPKEGRQQ